MCVYDFFLSHLIEYCGPLTIDNKTLNFVVNLTARFCNWSQCQFVDLLEARRESLVWLSIWICEFRRWKRDIINACKEMNTSPRDRRIESVTVVTWNREKRNVKVRLCLRWVTTHVTHKSRYFMANVKVLYLCWARANHLGIPNVCVKVLWRQKPDLKIFRRNYKIFIQFWFMSPVSCT